MPALHSNQLLQGICALLLTATIIVAVMQSAPVRAPEVAFTIVDGRRIDLRELAGRPVLVNFWSITCAVCLEELPGLATLYREMATDGLEVIGVAMSYDRPDGVVAQVQRSEIPYPVAIDIDASAAQAFGRIAVTPTWILIAPDGTVAYRNTGALDMDDLRNRIRVLVGLPKHRPLEGYAT